MSFRVVVVEDETLTRIDLIEILKENGYDVVGETALDFSGFVSVMETSEL